MLELLTLFGVAATGVLAGGLWDTFATPDDDGDMSEAEQAVVAAPEDSPLLPSEAESEVEQIAEYDTESEMLLIGVAPEYEGAGKIDISEAEDDPGTAIVSLDGSPVAEVPGAFGSLSLDGVELVELDNFA